MKLIRSLVRPEKVDVVRRVLDGLQVCAVTVSQVHDHAPQPYERAVWMGREYSLGFSHKRELTVVVHDDAVDDVVEAIIRTARTGQEGDGDVSVVPLDHRYSIRTGERCVS
jgi:nitrogen regulatory protein P-II 1